jgi:peptidyl-prolyl cis-trans isomerase C
LATIDLRQHAGHHRRVSDRRWYREPLVHFAVLGLALFGLFRVVGPTPQTGETIVVSAETLARIEAEQTRRLGRAPESAELDDAVRAWTDAEMLYREARALGLDRGDPIVRRRLMQKMQFLFEEAEPLPDPSDAQLERWIADHADRFEQAPRFALTHVYVQASSRTMPEAQLREIEVALAEGADPATLGQAFALGQELAAKTVVELNRSFGAGFGDAVAALPDQPDASGGGWHRVRSIYGWHLVHLDERVPGRLASVDEVRSQAKEGLLREAREQAAARALDELRERYAVEIAGRDE